MDEIFRLWLSHLGALGFGILIGWFVYYINRYRKGDVQFSDLTTLVGIIGGGSVTALFDRASGSMFGAYGIGLALGFFAYFFVLTALVSKSDNFTSDWFLDGRRKDPIPPFAIPSEMRSTITAMDPESVQSQKELAIQTAAGAAAATVAALQANKPPDRPDGSSARS